MEVRSQLGLEDHLTKHKFYRVVDSTDKEYTIINNSGIKYSYPKDAFRQVFPHTTMGGSQAKVARQDNAGHLFVGGCDPTKEQITENSLMLLREEAEKMGLLPVENSSENNGGSTDYYRIKPEWVMCQDIIEDKNMSWNIANIFKACFRFGDNHHSDSVRDLNKIIYFAERELKLLNKQK